MVERVECQSKDCTATILPSTAKKTGGFCMPCKQKADRLKHETYIRENRKDVDPFEGVTDRVEILKIMHQPRKYDPIVNYLPYKNSPADIYEELTEPEMARLIQYTIDNLHSDDKDNVLDIIKEIAAFTDTDISNVIQKLIEHQEYYPGYLFRNAGHDITVKLFDRINFITENQDIQLELNHLLEALAWIGTDTVISQFSQWRKKPPEWCSILYIPPRKLRSLCRVGAG